MRIARALRAALPGTWIIYGGVFPTFHWPEIMEAGDRQIDFIVRGEGEQTIVRLVAALESGRDPGKWLGNRVPTGNRAPVAVPGWGLRRIRSA